MAVAPVYNSFIARLPRAQKLCLPETREVETFIHSFIEPPCRKSCRKNMSTWADIIIHAHVAGVPSSTTELWSKGTYEAIITLSTHSVSSLSCATGTNKHSHIRPLSFTLLQFIYTPPPHIQTNHAGLALPTMLPSHHDPTTMKNINFLPARSSRQSSRTSNSLRGTLTPNSLLPTYPTHSFHPPMLQINHLSPGPPSR